MNWQKMQRNIILIIPYILALLILYRIRGVLLPFVLAFVITYLLFPLVKLFTKQKIPHILAIFLAYGCVATILAVIGIFLFPVIIQQLIRLGDSIPYFTEELTQFIETAHDSIERLQLPESVRIAIDKRLEAFEEGFTVAIGNVIEGLFGLFTHVISFFLAPIFAFYLLKDIERFKRAVVNAVPERIRTDAIHFFQDVDNALGGYIRGQIIVCMITGTISGLTMALLGVPFAALIGVFVAITDIVPFVGPIVGTIPAVTIALLQSPQLAIYVLASFILIQQIEANIFAPRIVSFRVGLHPLVVIFSLFVARELFGIPGMLIAVPSAATINVFGRHLYGYLQRNW